MEDVFNEILNDIVRKILAQVISKEEIAEQIQNELESKNIEEVDNLLITDCYYALKHIEEEKISPKELIYFQECFNGKRQYNLKDKIQFILQE